MIREILKIYTDKKLGEKNPSFKDIEISEYSYKGTRMGMPELTAALMWPTCLDDEWTNKEYVVLNEERFYIRHTPSSSKNNNDARYRHDINFTPEFAEILGNTYFIDVVPDEKSGIACLTRNKPCSNNSTFTFFGTIREFCDRLNCAFLYVGIGDSILKTKTSLTTEDNPVGDGFCAMLDPYGDYDIEKSYKFSFSDKKIWDAILEGYNITEIPFERRGRKFIFGAIPVVVEHKFEYGHDNELLSVSKKNANAQVINRIAMEGGSENIPYFYPNETEYGHISIAAKTGNKVLTTNMVKIANMTQMLSRLNADSFAVLGKYDGIDVGDAEVDDLWYSTSFADGNFIFYQPGGYLRHDPAGTESNIPWHIKVFFTVKKDGVVECKYVKGHVWTQNNTPPDGGVNMVENIKPERLETVEDKLNGVASVDYSSQIDKQEGKVSLGYLPKGEYVFQFSINIVNREGGRNSPVVSFCYLSSVGIGAADKQKTGYYWSVDGKKYDGAGALGVKISQPITDSMIGDGFGWTASGRMPFQDHLVPPKYRDTVGSERFYNAVSGTYTDPDTGKKYIFPNPFIEGAPSEHIHRNENIKPTIEGVTNLESKLFGVIADVAYDLDDNDALKSDSSEDGDKNDSLKYEHSFFYIKLNIFNGPYGFDLFAHASQSDPMTIQMQSGSCDGCKFKIQALEYEDETGLKSYKNPVQTVEANGDIVAGSYEDKVKKEWQEWQQNTQTHSIWICVQKDADTFGAIMPNKGNDFKPEIGDTFNIINIDLPQSYILAAEKRLEEDGIRFMADNNEEKFTFDISASRIFFANNPDILAQIDEYSKIKVVYNGKVYEQYISQFSIDCKDSEALPNIGIGLTDTLAVGQSFIDQVAERASSLISNATTMGGNLGSGGGINTALADKRYINKQRADRTSHKISSDTAFEVGEFVSGGAGAILMRDPETGQTYLEVDKIKARLKATFEELEIANVKSVGGKVIITPGGSIQLSFVEELSDSYRCYFKAKEEDKGTECRFIVGDEVQSEEFNITNGTHKNASNRYYWRLVTAVNNDESYIELSKTDCDTDSDAPMIGDTVCQLGNRNDNERQSAIVLSTHDAFAPCVTLYNGIDHYSLDKKAVVEYGVDKSKNPPEPFFNCYGRMYIGPRTKDSYLEFNPSDKKLVFKGKISVMSSVGDSNIGDYVGDAAKSAADKAAKELQAKIDELQKQVDGVIESWNGDADPTLSNAPASEWNTDADRIKHAGDVYFNIGAYDPVTNPNAGGAWRWYYNSPEDYGWIKIADSDAVKALQLAQMSIVDNDVFYIQTDSRTDAPALPSVNTSGIITDLKGWNTDAPEWKAGQYIWQMTYVRKGDGGARFAGPTCISGRDGENGINVSIKSQSVTYSTVHTSTQPADNTFTLTSVPTLSAGQYLWSKTTVEYSNGQKTTSYAVSRIGTNGTDGTSVTITSKSVTYAKTTALTQPADSSFTYMSITDANVKPGDYLWVKVEVIYSDGDGTKSYSVSRIGSDGDDGLPGLDGYTHFAYSNSSDGTKNFSTTYFDDALYIGTCSDHDEKDPVDPKAYTWARMRGKDGVNAKMVFLNADSTVFTYADNFKGKPTPEIINFSATLQGVTSRQWSYKLPGQDSFTNIIGETGETFSLRHDDAIWGTGTTNKSITIRCSSGDVSDEITVAKVSSGSDGADAYTILLSNESHIFEGDTEKALPATATSEVIAYKGASKVAATIGSITGMPTGMTVAISNNGKNNASFAVSVTSVLTVKQGVLDIPVTVDGKTFTQIFSWSLALRGKDGRGIVSVAEEYAISSSDKTVPADSEFSSVIPTMTAAKPYLWNREKTTYTDNTSETTSPILIGVRGANGVDGASITGVTNYYLASENASGVTTSSKGWTTDAGAADAVVSKEKPYLWNYEKITYSKGSPTETQPHVVGRYGKDGNGIDRIEEEYYLSTSQTKTEGGAWKSEANKPAWEAGKFMWTRTHIWYTDGTDETIGEKCVTGTPGTSVLAEYSADAKNWHPSFVSGDKWMRTSDDNGNTWSDAIKIVGEDGADGADGADGKWRKFQWAKNNSATTAPTTDWKDSPVTSSAGEYVWMRSGIVIPPATNPTSWENATRLTGDKGASGASVYMLDLSNEVAGIICNSAGNVTGSYPTSQATVWKGSTQVTKGVTYSIAQSTDATATVDANGLVSMSNLSADTATIVVQAIVDGITLQASINLYKVKPGGKGDTGAAAVVYSIEPSVDNISKSITGDLSDTSITCSVYKTTGNSKRVLTGEKTLSYLRLPDGKTGTLAHASGTSSAVDILNDTEAVIFELKDGSTVLDRERVPILSDASDLEIGGRNLLRNSDVLKSNSNYATGRYDLTLEPTVGDTYVFTLWGALADTKTDFKIYNSGGNIRLASLIKVEEGKYQAVFKWVNQNGTITANDKYINVYAFTSDQTGTSTINRVKLEKGNIGTDWTPAPEDINARVDTFDYLKEALKGNTVVDGGLVLSSLIKLGTWTGSGDSATMTKVYSGMNGLYDDNILKGRTIATWWGGDVVDRFDKNDNKIYPVPDNAAAALVRMDGSGYFSKGNIIWKADGSGNVAGGKLRWDASGNVFLGSGITVEGGSSGDKTLKDILNYMNSLNSLIVPVDKDQNELAWQDVSNAVALKAKTNFFSVGEITAFGFGSGSGSGSGGATALADLVDVNLSNLAKGHMLQYNGTHWVNIPSDFISKTEAASIYQPKGNYLTAHQTLHTLTLQKNGSKVGTFKPNADATINITDVASASTLSSHTGNTTMHITSAERTKWNKVVTDFNAITGEDSDTIINKWEEVIAFLNTYTEADTLANLLSNKADVSSLADYFKSGGQQGGMSAAYVDLTDYDKGAADYKNYQPGTYQISRSGYSELVVNLALNSGSTSALQFYTSYGDTASLKFRKTVDSNRVSGAWRVILTELNIGSYALTPSNYATTLDKIYVKKSGDTMTGLLTANGGVTVPTGKKLTIGDCVIEWDAANKALKFSKSIYSAGEVTALGAGSGTGSSGSGLIEKVYNSDSLGGTFNKTTLTETFNAHAINEIYKRVVSLEGGSALTVTTTGSGNAVTAVSKSGTTVTVTKGATFLTSHQSLANYVTLNTAQTISAKKTFSTQQAFTVATGTAPFTVSSTTKVANLYANKSDILAQGELKANEDMNTYLDTAYGGRMYFKGGSLHVENLPSDILDSNGCGVFLFRTSGSMCQIVSDTAQRLFYRIGTKSAANDWQRILTATNFASLIGTNYVKKTGDAMSGPLTLPRLNIIGAASSTAYLAADSATNAYMNINGRTLMTWDESSSAVRPGSSYNNKFALGKSDVRWSNIYSVLGNFSGQITSSVATGTSPFKVTSTTVNTNLNADMLDGIHASSFARGGSASFVAAGTASPRWVRIAQTTSYSGFGIITISNTYSNNGPNGVTIFASCGYRNKDYMSLTQIGKGAGLYTKARIVYPKETNDPYYLEVYYNTTSVSNTLYLRLANTYGFTLLTAYKEGEVPAGYETKEITFAHGLSTEYISAANQITSMSANAFRAINGNYGVILRNDGTSFWLLLTDSGNQAGAFNSLRPFSLHIPTGRVAIGNGSLYVNHGGNVGVGISDATYKLHVSGTFRASGAASLGSTLGVTGLITASSGVKIGDCTISWDSNAKALKFNTPIYSTGEVTALGAGSGGTSGGGVGLIQTVYSSKKLGDTFDDNTLTDTFNAYAINSINNRLKTVEGKYVTLDTDQTIAATKTFSKSVKMKTATLSRTVVTHDSGNDYLIFADVAAATIIRGTTISFQNTVGSSNIKFQNNGEITAGKFIKSGGSASQFLMADGSVKALSDITSAYVTALGTKEDYLTWTKNGTANNITVPYATKTIWLKNNNNLTYGNSGLQWFNISGTKGCAAKVNDTPTTAWWHILRFNHANTAGYYTDLAVPFNSDSFYWKCVRKGALAYKSWVQIVDAENIINHTAGYATRLRDNNFHDTNNRRTSANIASDNSAGVQAFLATSSMTEGKPSQDSHVLQFNWDNSNIYACQLAIPLGKQGLEWRPQGNAAWGDTQQWIRIIDANNYTNYIKKIGTATVGSASKPIYLSAGTPTALSATVGSGVKPVFLNSGTITASASNAGTDGRPIYLSSGTLTPISYIAEGYMGFGGPNRVGYVGPTDYISGVTATNRFEALPGTYIKVEKWNGSTWADGGLSDESKSRLLSYCGQTVQASQTNAESGNKIRVTVTATEGVLYFVIHKLFINISTNGVSNPKVIVERSLISSPDAFTSIGSFDIGGWSGWNAIYMSKWILGGSASQTSQYRKIRLTFTADAANATANQSKCFQIMNILAFGNASWNSPNIVNKYGRTYTYDVTTFASTFVGDILPSVNGTKNLGSAAARWLAVYTRKVTSDSTFYIDSASQCSIIFTINSVEKARFYQPNGWLGIGVSAPSCAIDALGSMRLSSSLSEAGGDVSLQLWRGTNASWRFINTSGTLKIQSNYTSAVTNWFDCIGVSYNTGNTTIKGLLTANGGVTVPTGKKLTIGDCVIEWDAANKALKFSKSIYSAGEVTALGAGSGTSGGSTSTSYNRLDAWKDYTTSKSGYVLSALLGNDLHTRLSQVEAGYVTLDSAQTITGKKTFHNDVVMGTENSFIGYEPRKKDSGGGWAYLPFMIKDFAGSVFASFGVYGTANALSYIYIGSGNFGDTTNLRISASGEATAAKFVKYNGTSKQFLKADGSVDSNTYLTTSTAASTYVKKSGDTMTGSLVMGTNHYIYGIEETSGEMLFFNGSRTIIGSVGASTSLATHLRSKTGHLTVGETDAASYTIWDSGNDGSGSGLDADLLDGTHKANLLTTFAVSGTNKQNLSITVGGTNKQLNLFGWENYGQRTVQKNDNNGNPTMFLIADVTSWIGSLNNAPSCGFVGRVVSCRTAGYMYDYSADLSIRTAYKQGTNETDMLLRSSNVYITPVIVTYQSKHYLAMAVSGSGRSLRMEGVFLNCLDSFIQLNYVDKSTLPSGVVIKTEFPSNLYYSYRASHANQLINSRTLWGRSFNGTANVSGDMTSVGNITGTAAMIVKANGILTLDCTSGVYLKYANDNTKSVVLNSTAFMPFESANEKLYLGTSSARWNGVFSTSGSFTSTVTITKDAAQAHLAFGRANNNYIVANQANGNLCFIANGKAVGTANSQMIISSHIYPGATNTVNLGTETHRWGTGFFANRLIVSPDNDFIDNPNTTTTYHAGSKYGSGSIELAASMPFIDLHTTKESTTSDYHARIILEDKSTLSITVATLKVKGNFFATGEVTALSTSDIRLKTNIRKIKGAVSMLRALGGYRMYDYSEHSGEKDRIDRVGLIYQSVGGNVGMMMKCRRDDGFGALNYLRPDYINLIGASVIENADEVALLKAEVRRLKKRVAELEAR